MTKTTARPVWWPTAEQKLHADAACAHPDLCNVTVTLTRTQRKALEALTQTERQWPLGRGRYAGDGPNQVCRYSYRTLQALVDAGLARWVYRYGVMPHVVLGDSK